MNLKSKKLMLGALFLASASSISNILFANWKYSDIITKPIQYIFIHPTTWCFNTAIKPINQKLLTLEDNKQISKQLMSIMMYPIFTAGKKTFSPGVNWIGYWGKTGVAKLFNLFPKSLAQINAEKNEKLSLYTKKTNLLLILTQAKNELLKGNVNDPIVKKKVAMLNKKIASITL